MAKSKIREIALISLPIVFLGGFSWWANGRQQQRAARENGPYRTRLVSMEDVPLTPFERWQGFDSKVRIVATDEGKPDLPASFRWGGRRELASDIFLSGKNGAKLPVASNGQGDMRPSARNPGALMRILDYDRTRTESENLELTFLADTKAVAGKAKLQGEIRFEIPVGFCTARPLQIERDLRAQNTLINRTAPRFISAQVAHFSPRETAIDPTGDNGDTFVEAAFDCSALKGAMPNAHFANEILEDEFGKEVEELDVNRTAANPAGQITFNDRVKTFSIPASRGQITFKTWFSYCDSWPTLVSVVVRLRPHTATPRKLMLQSVRLAGSNVEARVRYTGNLPLGTEQSAVRQDVSTFIGDRPAPRAAGTDRLLSNWSQHLEFAGGKKQWSGQYVGDARAQCKPDNTCVVTYPIPAMKSWLPGQRARFRAQIGIEDDGFLDIDLPIVKAK